MDVNVDSESSPKFKWEVDSRLKSPKYLLWPEYDLGVKSSEVALPRDDRRGVGVLSPLVFPFGRYPFVFLFKLFVLFGLSLEPKIASFSASRMLSNFFWSCKNAEVILKGHIISELFLIKTRVILKHFYPVSSFFLFFLMSAKSVLFKHRY